MSVEVHPTAVIDPQARLGDGVQVGPYAVIGPHAVLGAGVTIHNHATVTGHTTLGEGVQVFPGAVLGCVPQDLKYKGEPTTLEIGAGTIVRECATLHPGTALGGGRTAIGKNCLIMAYAHIAHDCILADQIIVANASQLAGHVHVQEGARISGLCAIHHFVTIGRGSFVGGSARLSIDVPPHTLAEGHPARIRGLNLEGLRRRGITGEPVAALKSAFRLLVRDKGSRAEAYAEIEREGYTQHPVVAEFVRFVKRSDAGKNGRALEAERQIVPPSERDGDLSFRPPDGAEMDEDEAE
ncbi:MAG: acyl-[acyl-carrier-protein]--UDP-N-acetylglucosamine O-acyltransferase [Planctomycetota bacterium]